MSLRKHEEKVRVCLGLIKDIRQNIEGNSRFMTFINLQINHTSLNEAINKTIDKLEAIAQDMENIEQAIEEYLKIKP